MDRGEELSSKSACKDSRKLINDVPWETHLATVVQILRFPVERKIGNLDLSLKSPVRLLACFDSKPQFLRAASWEGRELGR